MEKIKKIKQEILGVLAVSSGLVIILSLATHSEWDPSPFTYNPADKTGVKNLLGVFGSYLSDILFQIFGLAAYIIPVMLFIYGVRKILGHEDRHRPAVAAAAITVLGLSLCSLLTLMFNSSHGGVIGSFFTTLSIKAFSTTGSYLLFIPLVFVTLMFLVPFSLVDFIRGTKKVSKLGSVSIPLPAKKKKEPVIGEAPESPAQTTPYKQESLPLVYQSEPRARAAKKTKSDYELPSIELLKDAPQVKSKPSKEDLLSTSELLEKKLQDFSIEGKVTQVSPGPVVTMFEFEPAPGIKINKVVSLADDLALTLKATSLRISPVAGRSTLGIEVPNREREAVYLKDLLASEAFKKSSSKLTLALGKDIFGSPVATDLSRMPHLLIAGATGSGKSVCINSMVLSLLYRATPKEVKMLMIDPKRLELPIYEEIPHLMLPIITSPKDAAEALKKIVLEMERRYKVLAETGSRNIETYNKKIKSSPPNQAMTAAAGAQEAMPYIVIIIDELADLMLVAAQEVENSIARLAQMARAAGIHLILATQRPSVDVITGVIKANFAARISFHVASKIDSRIILDTYGAEQLLGKGDMLFMSPGNRMLRIHGTYISEEEIRVVVDFIKAQGLPDYTLFESLESEKEEEADFEGRDELYREARELVLSTGQASISYIQRRLKIGYNRAASIMELMEEEGIVGPPGEAGKPREILRRRR